MTGKRRKRLFWSLLMAAVVLGCLYLLALGSGPAGAQSTKPKYTFIFLTDWFKRIKTRPAYQRAIVSWYDNASPYAKLLEEKGAESWPRIQAMLEGGLAGLGSE